MENRGERPQMRNVKAVRGALCGLQQKASHAACASAPYCLQNTDFYTFSFFTYLRSATYKKNNCTKCKVKTHRAAIGQY